MKSPSFAAWVFLLTPSILGAGEPQEVTIYRDEFGTPHIFSATAEGACYGAGFAQAEDRLEEILKQYRRATGTMSEAFGPSFLKDDYRQRLWRHAAISREKYHELTPKSQALIEAYQTGVKDYMRKHPEEVPVWAPQIEPWMCVALSRYIIWGWPEGDAGGDLARAGIKPDPIEYRGSNEWLISRDRSAYDAPIALIDPHLGWYGQFRFYELRLYGGELIYSGMSIAGNPLPTLGHSPYCSVAMTTGGPDAADCYEEEIHPENSRQYKYDGEWREMTVRNEIIKVKDNETIREQEVQLEYTHHGPVVARREGKAYALKLPYFYEVTLADQGYKMITAKNLAEMKQALGMLQFMEQNIMVATVDGDIYYVRNGRVPVRAPGYDYKRPIPGNTSKTEWLGIHPLEDLLHLHNPPQGYMQNCNVSPQFVTRNSSIKPELFDHRPYLFNGYYGPTKAYDNPLHQRAAMAEQILDQAEKLTADDAISIAMNTQVFLADVWQERLTKAWNNAGEEYRQKPGPAALYKQIRDWNRHCDADSTGAIAYHYWKEAFGPDMQKIDRAAFAPPPVEEKVLLANLEQAAAKMMADFGKYEVPYGEVYRVGREGTKRNWPVSGGSVAGIATPRAIGFKPIENTKTFLGSGGQTSTQIVVMTKPPKSWTVLPLGESDHPNSPHYDDQAEKLFSKGKMKPTYFMDKDELLKHVESKTVLTYAGK